MKYGQSLPAGGTIGFAAPSFGCAMEPYRSCFVSALDVLEDMGFHLDLGPNCFAGEGTGISNTPELCGKELTDYYLSKANDCLIACGGGELMCEILDYVDWDRIKQAPPKRFMGFSDNTNMTFLLTTLCDVASIYGPCAPAFGVVPWHDVTASAFRLLTSDAPAESVHGYDTWEKESLKDDDNPLAPFNLTEPKILKYHAPGTPADQLYSGDEIPGTEFCGRLIGGCLDCLGVLSGTVYDRVGAFAEKYKEDGIIWFMEACDLNVFDIRRTVWKLEHTGWFKYTRGFLFGRPHNGLEPIMGLDRYRAVLDVLSGYDVPVLMDIDLGHLPPSMPLVLGSMAKVHVNGNDISIDMEMRE